MRYFNTSGPCFPEQHYTVLRQDLVAQGVERVRKGKFITIFAPRQAGKTTYFHLLFESLRGKNTYVPIWLSFEDLKTVSKKDFYEILNHELSRELSKLGIQPKTVIRKQAHLARFFESLREQCEKVVLVIDEFEGVPQAVLGELMHTFRKMYHRKVDYALHSLILIGVSTVAELVISDASPFNVVDEIKIPYFSFEEVRELISQYIRESGQKFEAEVIRAIHQNTNGQPGLVCALCEHLIEKVATDRSQPVTMVHFYTTLKHFLTERFDKNIINIVQKAREKKPFMLRLLFNSDDPIPFTIHDPVINFLYAHGVVENVDGSVDVEVPLYKKALITSFRPTFNGETEYYFSTHDSFSDYLHKDGLHLKPLLRQYAAYVKKRGFQAFNTEHLKEGAWHYSLDGFMIFFIDRIGGQTFVEVPSGRGRTDILILYQNKKYIIETKIYRDRSMFEKGKKQLAAYLESEGLEAGYYVVFSRKHSDADTLEQEEIIEGKKIYTLIVRVDFERASG